MTCPDCGYGPMEREDRCGECSTGLVVAFQYFCPCCLEYWHWDRLSGLFRQQSGCLPRPIHVRGLRDQEDYYATEK